MPVNALYPYKYPSRSRRELYGDDIMVHLGIRDNMLFAAPSTYRLSPTTTWAEFIDGTVNPWIAMDPHVDPAKVGGWTLDGTELTPQADDTLAELGVAHKSMLTFQAH